MTERPSGPVELSGDHVRLPGARRTSGTWLFVVLVVLGLVLLASVTAAAGMTCSSTRSCDGARWWGWVLVGAGAVLLGLTGWSRRAPSDRPVGRQPASVTAEAVVAGVAVFVAMPPVAQLMMRLLTRSDVAFVGSVLLAAGLAWTVAAWLHGWVAGGRRRDEVLVAGVAALAAATASGSIAYGGTSIGSFLPSLPLLWAIALALTVVAVRAPAANARLAGVGAVLASGLALLTAVPTITQVWSAYLPTAAPPEQMVVPDPAATPELSSSAPTEPASASPSPEESVVPPSGDLCTSYLLTTQIGVPVPGGHDVATTITVTNGNGNGDGQDCRIEGWPSVRLLADGEDLALFVHVANVNPATGEHVDEGPMTLEPGQSAQTQVWWPANGAAADLQADQEVHLGVGGTEVAIFLPAQSRWDVVRGSEVWVAPWQRVDADAGE